MSNSEQGCSLELVSEFSERVDTLLVTLKTSRVMLTRAQDKERLFLGKITGYMYDKINTMIEYNNKIVDLSTRQLSENVKKHCVGTNHISTSKFLVNVTWLSEQDFIPKGKMIGLLMDGYKVSLRYLHKSYAVGCE